MRKISKTQIAQGIERSNPWWKGIGVGFQALPRRTHFNRLYALVRQSDPVRALILMGPRRVGKTVLIYQIIYQMVAEGVPARSLVYLSLDNPIFRLNSLEELMLWSLEWSGADPKSATIFFDEIQYLDDWEQQLKVLVDAYRSTKFIVTGSAAAALHKKSRESGAGRFTNYLIPALSFYEFVYLKGHLDQMAKGGIDILKLNSLYLDYLNYGGFPEALTSKVIQDQPEIYIGQDILDKVLGRDLPSLYGINNPNELSRLFTALAYNSSNEISYKSICEQSGVPREQINRYIAFLEAAYLLKVIEKTDQSLKTFTRKTTFKVVLTNPSLRSAIFSNLTLEDRDLEGMAETAVFSQLVVPEGTYFPFRYAKWKNGGSQGEVDLVCITPENKPVAAIEIKWTDRFAERRDKPRSLLTFCKAHKITKAYMSSRSHFATQTFADVTIEHIPTAVLCFTIGMQIGVLDDAATFGNLFEFTEGIDPAEFAKRIVDAFGPSMKAVGYLTSEMISHLGHVMAAVNGIIRPRRDLKELKER